MGRVIGRILRLLLIILLVLTVAFFLFRRKYQDVIVALAQTQVINTTSDLINDAIDQQIATGDILYDRIVYFEKDLDGRITALKTNMSEVNRLKTQVLNIINDEILALDASELGIPLGNIFFPEFLSGRGMAIPVEILAIRNSDASFTSDFSEAGINQTLHRLNMEVRVEVYVLVQGRKERITVNSQVMVAETIIIGQVPDTLLQTGG